MKAILLTAMGVCAAGLGFAQVPNSASAFPSQKTHSTQGWCQLGSECLGVSKIPLKACRVTTKKATAQDACAVDGMKLVGKFTVTSTSIL
jgi:hypothetical protein